MVERYLSPRKRLGAALLVSLLALTGNAWASSHREAPFITELPKVDGTDLYAFTSYETGREGFVTLIANYLPLQDAYGGPNYFTMDPEAAYEILVDNNGDAREDVTFRFKFFNASENLSLEIGSPTSRRRVAVPLANIGQVGPSFLDNSARNVLETYTIDVIRGPRRQGKKARLRGSGGDRFVKPIDNIGNKSIPAYESYARTHIYNVSIPGCDAGRVFVGQRKEPFVVNLGETFDLVNIQNPVGSTSAERNTIDDKNITSLVLEVPKDCLTQGRGNVIGVWTTASLPQIKQFRLTPRFSKPEFARGRLVQVSRLGNPLVNEVVIGLPDKDLFNASEPRKDAQFAKYVTHPTFPALVEALFGEAGVRAPTRFPRTDLVSVFLTGVTGLTDVNGAAAEMMRLNVNVPPVPAAQQNPLGVLGGDLAGYPNGRRPGDDVVDITLRAAMGALLPANEAPSGSLPFTDGAFIDASAFDSVFPYLKAPLAGSPDPDSPN